jgi:hypothetical protein
MATFRYLLTLLIIAILCSCSNPSGNGIGSATTTSTDTPATSTTATTQALSTNERSEADTIITIAFNELSLSISRLAIFDEGDRMAKSGIDTVTITAELGESIEGQLITIANSQLTNLTIEQRYETSVTIAGEGPHCDLLDWKHFYSDWKPLPQNSKGQFTCHQYTVKDAEKFPAISMDSLRQQVKQQCGDEWAKPIANAKTLSERPINVGISRYYLRVTGTRKDNGQSLTKLIIVNMPMGC